MVADGARLGARQSAHLREAPASRTSSSASFSSNLAEQCFRQAEDRPHLISVDPASRLAAMLLPTNTGGDGTLALLPFFTEELDWDSLGMDREGWESSQQEKGNGGQRGGS
jgi:hypothetical protein